MMEDVKVEFPALSDDEQVQAIAAAIYEKHKGDIIKEIKSKLLGAGGQRDVSVSWSKSF